MDCCNTAGTTKQAEFDALVSACQCEVERYEVVFKRLVGTLVPPQETDAPEAIGEDKQAPPRTVQEALLRIVNMMANTNERLSMVVNRLQEQVGELKILP